jgi:diguanylate cyclase (GGDEF)-like protein
MSSSRNLQTTLALRVALIAGLFALVAGAAGYRWSYAQSMEQSRVAILALGKAVERTAAVGAYTNDPVLLQEVADGVAQSSLVSEARIVLSASSVVSRGAGQAASDSGAGRDALALPLMSPFDATERVGELRLVPDTAAIQYESARHARLILLLLVGLTALVAVSVNWTAQQLVAAPIGRMAAELGRMAAGGDERLTLPRAHENDELGGLVQSANRLLESNTAALRSERDLRAKVEAMEAHYRRIFNSSSAGIFVLDDAGCLLNANPTVYRMLSRTGTTVSQAMQGDFLGCVFAKPVSVRALVDEAKKSRLSVTGDFELRTTTGNPQWVHCLFSVQGPTAEDPDLRSVVEGVLYDVTERRHAELIARHAAAHDTLTGLLARAACAAAVAAWRREPHDFGDERYAVLFIDLDGFKAVNDRHGHGAGDEVLREVARRLLLCTRGATDVVSRNGGDEFVVVLRGLGTEDHATSRIAGNIVQHLQLPVVLEGNESVLVGASIGIASFPRHGTTFDAVLAEADSAMYLVKHTGKNNFALAALPQEQAWPALAEPAQRRSEST